MIDLEFVIRFALEAHAGQTRKYTGMPYITHPLAVMEIVSSVPHSTEMLAAAVLHDTVEDTDVTIKQISSHFGKTVAEMVKQLTDISKPEDGNRATRKEIDRMHLKDAWPDVKTIKLADLIHNSESIFEHDKEFAKIYMKEKELLLEVLTEGDSSLMECAEAAISNYKYSLSI